MEWFDNLVIVVASENKSTVSGELLNRRSKEELYVGSGIVCFVNDDDFMFRVTRKRETVDAKFFALFRTVSRKRPSSDPLMT